MHSLELYLKKNNKGKYNFKNSLKKKKDNIQDILSTHIFREHTFLDSFREHTLNIWVTGTDVLIIRSELDSDLLMVLKDNIIVWEIGLMDSK